MLLLRIETKNSWFYSHRQAYAHTTAAAPPKSADESVLEDLGFTKITKEDTLVELNYD